MDEELVRLEAELEKVKGCGLEYLPEYGFSSKEEIMQLIQEDINELRSEMECIQKDYATDELEEEAHKVVHPSGNTKILLNFKIFKSDGRKQSSYRITDYSGQTSGRVCNDTGRTNRETV